MEDCIKTFVQTRAVPEHLEIILGNEIHWNDLQQYLIEKKQTYPWTSNRDESFWSAELLGEQLKRRQLACVYQSSTPRQLVGFFIWTDQMAWMTGLELHPSCRSPDYVLEKRMIAWFLQYVLLCFPKQTRLRLDVSSSLRWGLDRFLIRHHGFVLLRGDYPDGYKYGSDPVPNALILENQTLA